MTWIRRIVIAMVMVLLGFAFAKYYVIEDAKKEKIEKEIPFSLQEIYLQYNHLQKFVRWNENVLNSKDLSINYYYPYQGKGSRMSYRNKKGNISGELSIIEEKDLKYIEYQFFNAKQNPLYVKVYFSSISDKETKVTYVLEKPSKTILDKITSYFKDEPTFFLMNEEVDKLENLLTNRIDKEKFFKKITYDSLIREEQPEQIVLGKHFSEMNHSTMVRKNLAKNIAQLQQYIQVSLEKKEDEYGFPLIITDANRSKSKEISYYLGVPLSQSTHLKEKKYGFRSLASSSVLAMFYKGEYSNAKNTANQLVKLAKRDSLNYGKVQYIFLETPQNTGEVKLKIILPVSK